MTLKYDMPYETYSYKWEAPEGDVFVRIARENGHVWIDTNVGKAGTTLNADAFAISALAGVALRGGVDPRKVILALKGVSHEASNPLLARQRTGALSIADAIGKTIENEYFGGEHAVAVMPGVQGDWTYDLPKLQEDMRKLQDHTGDM